jgi:hypothetical protein
MSMKQVTCSMLHNEDHLDDGLGGIFLRIGGGCLMAAFVVSGVRSFGSAVGHIWKLVSSRNNSGQDWKGIKWGLYTRMHALGLDPQPPLTRAWSHAAVTSFLHRPAEWYVTGKATLWSIFWHWSLISLIILPAVTHPSYYNMNIYYNWCPPCYTTYITVMFSEPVFWIWSCVSLAHNWHTSV